MPEPQQLVESKDHTKTAGGRDVQVSLWISKSAGAEQFAEQFDHYNIYNSGL